MKKILSIITVAVLCTQTVDMQAMDTMRRYGRGARAAAGRFAGGAMQAPGKIAAWAGPFLSEFGGALQAGDFQALRGIVQKYRAQSAAAGVTVAAITAAIIASLNALANRLSGGEKFYPYTEEVEVSLSIPARMMARRYNVNLNKINNKKLLSYAAQNLYAGVSELLNMQRQLGQTERVVDMAAIEAALELATDQDTINRLKVLKNWLPKGVLELP